jgi:hypothetical protein
MCLRILLVGLLIATLTPIAVNAKEANDNAALRRKCAHLIKVKLNIKETGQVRDLAGIPGAVQMVDQCVANGGKP